jgi:hypothetical protein
MGLVIMGGLAISTVLTSLLLPTTATLSEDIFGALGRLPGRLLQSIRRILLKQQQESI